MKTISLNNHKNHYHLLMRTGYPVHFEYDDIPKETDLIFMNGVFRHGSRFWSSKYSLYFHDLIKKNVIGKHQNKKNNEDTKLITSYYKLIKSKGVKEVGNICNKGNIEMNEIGKKIYLPHREYFKKVKKINYETTKKVRTIQTKDVLIKSINLERKRNGLAILKDNKINTKNSKYPIHNAMDFRGIALNKPTQKWNDNNKKIAKTFTDNYKFIDSIIDKYINKLILNQVRIQFGINRELDYVILKDMIIGIFNSLTITGTYKYKGLENNNISCFPSKYNSLQETMYSVYVKSGLCYSFYIVEFCRIILTRTIANIVLVKLSNVFLHQIGEDLDKAMLKHNSSTNRDMVVDPVFYFGHAEVIMPVLAHLLFMHRDLEKESLKINKKLRSYIDKMPNVQNLEADEASDKLKKMYSKLVEYGSKLVSNNNNLNWVTPMSSNLVFRLLKSRKDKEYYIQILLNGRTFSPPSFKQQKMIKLREFRDMLLKNYLTSKEFKKLSGLQ